MKKGILLASACMATFGIYAPGTAFAQGEVPDAAQPAGPGDTSATSANSNDIIVTARRREERLQDVPLSVSALGEEQLKTSGIANISDIGSGRVPGLSMNTLFGVETALGLNIRGFGPNDASQGTIEMPVALYIDGVPYARSQGNTIDLITPQRIEVLRGPQGQLFGRNAQAGAVNIISRRPSGNFSGEITTGIGNFGLIKTKGRIDLPALGGLKIQLSGNYRRHGGYYNNPFNPALQGVALFPTQNAQSSFRFPVGNYSRDLSQLKTYGGRVAAEYDAGPFNAYYSFDYTKATDDQGPTWFRNSPKGGTIFNPLGGTGPVTIFTTAGPGGTPLNFLEQPLGNKVPSNAPYALPFVPMHTKAYGHMLNLTFEASDSLTLRSITGSRFVRRMGGNVLTAAVNPVLPGSDEYMRSKTFSQELQAIYDVDNFNITAGGIYFNEKVKDERESLFGVNCLAAPGFGNFCTPNGQPSRPFFNFSLGSQGFKRSLSETDAYGLYAQATWTPPILDGRLDLTAGVRYSKSKKAATRKVDFGLNPATGVVNLSNLFKTDRVDPAFSIQYKVNDDVNIFARYAVGYRDGGSSVRSPNFGSYREDELESMEIGFKSDLFDRRLRLNVAAFYNRIKDEQLNLQSDPSLTPSLTDTFNSPVTKKAKGIEVETTLRPIEGLTLTANYTYLDVTKPIMGLDKVVLGVPPSSFIPVVTISEATGLIPSAATIAAHPNSTIIQLGPQGTPKHAAFVAVDYEVDNVHLNAEWLRSTTSFVGAPAVYQTLIVNGVATPARRYNSGIETNRFNASLTYKNIIVGETTAEIRLWMKNIFNHADGAFAFPAGNPINAASPRPNSIIYLQPPRTFGADLTIAF